MNVEGINLFAKIKRIGNSNTHRQNMMLGHRNGIWHRKMLNVCKKGGKRHLSDGIELPNKENIKTFEKKGTYKYF